MFHTKWQRLTVFSLILFAAIGSAGSFAQNKSRDIENIWGPRYRVSRRIRMPERHPFRHGSNSLDRLKHWNEVGIDASGLDHTPVADDEPGDRVFGEQLGPGRSARAMAIVHIAIFDAVNAIVGGYESYTGLHRVREATSIDSAIAKAAHDTLCAMFPSQTPSFDQLLSEDLDDIPGGPAKANGIELGRRAAARILAMRSNDGSQHTEPRVGIEWITSNQPGRWRQDPISLIPLALGAHWGEVRPFVLNSARQFRVDPPPPMTSARYTNAFNEVKRLGGDGITTLTERTDEQTVIGIYWAYDGTPSLCARRDFTIKLRCESLS